MPDHRFVDTQTLAITATAEALAENTRAMGSTFATQHQVYTLVRALEAFTTHRTLRLRMLQRVFPHSGVNGQPLTSTKDLSMAQASALLTHLYGANAASFDCLTDDGQAFLENLRAIAFSHDGDQAALLNHSFLPAHAGVSPAAA